MVQAGAVNRSFYLRHITVHAFSHHQLSYIVADRIFPQVSSDDCQLLDRQLKSATTAVDCIDFQAPYEAKIEAIGDDSITNHVDFADFCIRFPLMASTAYGTKRAEPMS